MTVANSSSDSEAELTRKLVEGGKTLLNPYGSSDELLKRLDDMFKLLKLIEQTTKTDVLEAFQPLINAIATTQLLNHQDLNVTVSTICCICEILRITAPDPPYHDDKMKDICELLLMIFKRFSSLAGHSYAKAVAIIDCVANCQLYMLMWDINEAFIIEMCKYFFLTTDSTARVHPAYVISNMENIMTLIVKEDDEDIPVSIFNILLEKLKKENKNVAPCSYGMAERVFRRCAVKLKPLLSANIVLDDYSEIVTRVKLENEVLIAEEGNGIEEVKNNASENGESVQIEKEKGCVVITDSQCHNSGDDSVRKNDKLEDDSVAENSCPNSVTHNNNNDNDDDSVRNNDKMKNDTTLEVSLGQDSEAVRTIKEGDATGLVREKRKRKPNSLLKPEEGYNSPLMSKAFSHIPRRTRNFRSQSGPSKEPSAPVHDSESLGKGFPKKKRSSKRSPLNQDKKASIDEDNKSVEIAAKKQKRDKLSSENVTDSHTQDSDDITALQEETESEAVKTPSPKKNKAKETDDAIIVPRKKDKPSSEDTEGKSQLKTLPLDSLPDKVKRKRKRTQLKQEVSNVKKAENVCTSDNETLIAMIKSKTRKLPKVTSYEDASTSGGKKLTSVRKKSKLESSKSKPERVSNVVSTEDESTSYGKKATSVAKKSKSERVLNENVTASDAQKLEIRSKFKSDKGQANYPATTPDTSKVKSPSPKLQVKNESKKISKGKKPMKGSSSGSSKKVEVHGYLVRARLAPILNDVFAKYGDVARNCPFKTPNVRASLLEVVCSVIKRLKKHDITTMDINGMLAEVTAAVKAKIEVTWLQDYLLEILNKEEAAKKSSEIRKKVVVAMSAAQIQLKKIEKSVEVLDIMSKKVETDIKNTVMKENRSLEKLDELLSI